VVLAGIELSLFLLALVSFAPGRFRWAGRALAAIVFFAFAAYVVDMARTRPSSFWPPSGRSAATGFNSVLGLLVIGYPALKYALVGRFTWREPVEEDSDPIEEGFDDESGVA
jgi:hypothetical protein